MSAANLPPSSPVDPVRAAAIDRLLVQRRSPLAGKGAVFVSEGYKNKISPEFLVAISGAETSFGVAGGADRIKNPFGLGPGRQYPSWDASIAAAASNLNTNSAYRGKTTIATIQSTWAPGGARNDPHNLNSNWQGNVGQYFRQLGGDPGQPVRGGTPLALGASSGLALPALQRGPGGVVLLPTLPTAEGSNVFDSFGNRIGLGAIGSAIGGGAAAAQGAVAAPINAIGSGIGAIGDVAGAVLQKSFWIRALEVVGGSVLIVVALVIIARTADGSTDARDVGKGALGEAAQEAVVGAA